VGKGDGHTLFDWGGEMEGVWHQEVSTLLEAYYTPEWGLNLVRESP